MTSTWLAGAHSHVPGAAVFCIFSLLNSHFNAKPVCFPFKAPGSMRFSFFRHSLMKTTPRAKSRIKKNRHGKAQGEAARRRRTEDRERGAVRGVPRRLAGFCGRGGAEKRHGHVSGGRPQERPKHRRRRSLLSDRGGQTVQFSPPHT